MKTNQKYRFARKHGGILRKSGSFIGFFFSCVIFACGCGRTGLSGPDSSADASGPQADPNADLVLKGNPDPLDPELAVLTAQASGESLVLFGEKDAQGNMTQARAIQYYSASDGAEPSYSILLDDQGRPVMLSDDAGRQALIEYDDANQSAVVYYHDSTGVEDVRSADVSAGQESVDSSSDLGTIEIVLFPTSDRAVMGVRRDNGVPATTKQIRFVVTFELVQRDNPSETYLSTIPDAAVQPVVSNGTQPLEPADYNEREGVYEFTLVHRIADVDFLVRECDRQIEESGAVVELARSILESLFTGCVTSALVGAPVCGLFSGAITALGLGGAWSVDHSLEELNVACEALRREAETPTRGRVSVTVNASVPRLKWTGSQTVEYDLLNPDDPITFYSLANVRFQIPADCGGCPSELVCDGERCVECVFAGDCATKPRCDERGKCVDCLSQADCRTSSTGPNCVNEACVACRTNEDCEQWLLGRICVLPAGQCGDCLTDEDCAGNPYGPTCGEGFSCEGGSVFGCPSPRNHSGDGLDGLLTQCAPPTGACCKSDGSCETATTFQCTSEGGTYRGDGASCAPDSCAPPVEYVIWYTGNVSCWAAPYLYITDRAGFDRPDSASNYPGGGIDPSVPLEKVELQGGFDSTQAALNWLCPRFTSSYSHYWCARHYVMEGQPWMAGGLGCDFSNLPPEP